MKKKISVALLVLFFTIQYNAQDKGVAIGKTKNEASAILDIASSNYDKTGVGAIATAIVSGGTVTAINLVNGGTGYVAPVTVSIYGTDNTFGVASGARATAIVSNGEITGFTLTNGGSGYVSGKTEVSINSGNKGVLIPRVDLVNIYNGTTPVSNPKDGLFVYNKTPTYEKKGIYFWNQNTATPSLSHWDRGIPYLETPRGSVISYKGNDQYICDDGGAGCYNGVGSTTDDIFVFDLESKSLGFKSFFMTGDATDTNQYINIEPGTYKFEFTYYLIAPPANPSTRGRVIDNSSLYFMGYLMDLYIVEYNPATLAKSTVQPNITKPTPIGGVRLRKEYGVVSGTDQWHRMTQIYNLSIPEPASGKKYCIRMNLGRMSGSTLVDKFTFSRTNSYIKVNKY